MGNPAIRTPRSTARATSRWLHGTHPASFSVPDDESLGDRRGAAELSLGTGHLRPAFAPGLLTGSPGRLPPRRHGGPAGAGLGLRAAATRRDGDPGRRPGSSCRRAAAGSDGSDREQPRPRSGRPGSRCPSRGRPRSRSRGSSGSPRPRDDRVGRDRRRPASPPEPVLVEAGVEVVPREHLVVVALADGVPVEVDAGVGERAPAGGHPAVVGEVLAPAVETAAVTPHLLDHGADTAVAAGEQSLDRSRACRRGSGSRSRGRIACRRGRVAQLACRRASVVSWSSWAAHWNGVCGLGTKPPIETVQRMSWWPVTSRPPGDHLPARGRRSRARRRRSRWAGRT